MIDDVTDVMVQEIQQQEAALRECEDEFAKSLLVTADDESVSSLLSDTAAVSTHCDASLRSLEALQTKLQQESQHDLCTSVSTVHHQWTQLLAKVYSYVKILWLNSKDTAVGLDCSKKR